MSEPIRIHLDDGKKEELLNEDGEPVDFRKYARTYDFVTHSFSITLPEDFNGFIKRGEDLQVIIHGSIRNSVTETTARTGPSPD